MALNALMCNHLASLGLKGLNRHWSRATTHLSNDAAERRNKFAQGGVASLERMNIPLIINRQPCSWLCTRFCLSVCLTKYLCVIKILSNIS